MFRRILLWFTGMLILSFVGFLLTNFWRWRREPGGDMMRRLNSYQIQELESAYESGGVPALRPVIARMNQVFPAQHYLVNARNIDVVSGQDLSRLVQQVHQRTPYPALPPARMLLKVPSSDGRYFLLIDAGFGRDPFSNLAVYGWIVVALVLLCYVLAWTLAKPVQQLHHAVVRFGGGDLSSRAHSKRKDELGELSRAFDDMADRITTLLTAERRLLQDISHELRSPLARLKFALALILSSPDLPAAVARANQEVERLTTLIGELLEVTRAEGDPQSRNIASVELDGLVAALVESCQIEAHARECQLTIGRKDQITWFGDRELMHRAVENIIRNAINHSPRGSTVDVDLIQEDAEIIIRVRDRGPGVPFPELEKIFRPFYRVDEHRNRNQGGVGLGLAIARRAVDLHHGDIRARNADPGLQLEIRLPHHVKAAYRA